MELLKIGKQEGWSKTQMQEIRKLPKSGVKKPLLTLRKDLPNLKSNSYANL
jgi:hypothetical protein